MRLRQKRSGRAFCCSGAQIGFAEIYTAAFIGALFAFFVEPVAERLRAGRFKLAHRGAHGGSAGLVAGMLVPLSMGIALVCVHESMASFLGGAHAEHGAKAVRLSQAIRQALEWASVPAAVTAAWFVAQARREWAAIATAAACAWTVAAGFIWGWMWQEVVLTSVIGCLIAVGGTIRLRRGWDSTMLPDLARVVALTAALCVPGTLLLQAILGWAGYRAVELYTFTAAYEDIRFYCGWVLGLSFAPDPVPYAARQKDDRATADVA